jgi:SNF2 family DNA or RNA helicase
MSECVASGIKRVAKITGDTLSKKRQEIVDDFQDGNLDILFCSITAANAGITLTAADTVVFLEREWVSGWEEQAEDRVLRIGATGDTCWAIYLTVDGTIDQHFDRVVEEKRRVISSILNGTEEAVNRGEIVEQILQGMVESGQVPASMLDDYRQGKGNNKGAKKYE